MSKKSKPLTDKVGEVRELSAADLKRMRPAREVVPEIVAAYRRGRGRPAGQTKTQVTLRLDKELIAVLRKGGSFSVV